MILYTYQTRNILIKLSSTFLLQGVPAGGGGGCAEAIGV